jgi:PHP domain
MNILKSFPPESELLLNSQTISADIVHKSNAHIHTPYSFSAFTELRQAFELAAKENIRILGINDFSVIDGYDEFYENSLKSKIFPLFNIEFVSLSLDFQKRGIRVNDPNNPGRIYFSGKGLDYPGSLPEVYHSVIHSSIIESQQQVALMVNKTNDWLGEINADFRLDFQEIKNNYAQNLVRERHIAKALRVKILQRFPFEEDRKLFLKKFFYGNDAVSNLENTSEIENEIRNRILKSGGKAFVEESPQAFLNLESIIDIIFHAGGIPCYPVLLDGPKGFITEFERNKENLIIELSKKDIFCIELIPCRNDYEILTEFVHFFHANGFIVLFGTEHNTPELAPLTVSCREQVALNAELARIGFEGACVIAAHQYLRAQGIKSKVFQWNLLSLKEKSRLIVLGRSVVERFLNS